jgi:hypothetical protein
MRSIHRTAQRLASIVALAVIGAASVGADRASAGPTTITFSPSPATAGQAVTITLAGQGCLSGFISYGDGSEDESFAYGATGKATMMHNYAGAGTYAIKTYFDAASVADLVGPQKTTMINNGKKCVGGPVTLQVLSSGKTTPAPSSAPVAMRPAATGTAVATMPQPRCPANLTLVGDGKTMPYRCQMNKPVCPAGMVWFEEGNVVGCGQPLSERPVNQPE